MRPKAVKNPFALTRQIATYLDLVTAVVPDRQTQDLFLIGARDRVSVFVGWSSEVKVHLRTSASPEGPRGGGRGGGKEVCRQ